MWLDLYTFSNCEDFIAACRWLHRDEEDPEFAYLNFENYPSEWYSENCMDEDTFERILCFMPAKFRKISHKPHGLTGINSLPDALPCNLKKKTIKVNNPLKACRSVVFPVFSHPKTEDN